MTAITKRHRQHNQFFRSLSGIVTASAVAFTALVLISPPAQAGFEAQKKICFAEENVPAAKRIVACKTLLRDYNPKPAYVVHNELAKAYIDSNDYSYARRQVKKAQASAPGNRKNLAAIRTIYARIIKGYVTISREPEKAELIIRKLVRSNPGSITYRIMSAQFYADPLGRQNMYRAIKIYGDILGRPNGDFEQYCQEWRDSLNIVQRALFRPLNGGKVKCERGRYTILLLRAMLYLRQGYEKGDNLAIDDLSRALNFDAMGDNDREFVTYWRGIARFKLGQYKLAAEDFTKGMYDFPSQTYKRRAAYRLGSSLELQGKYDSAEGVYKEALKIAKRTNIQEQMEDGEALIGYDVDIPKIYIMFRLGIVSVQLKKYNKAIELLTASTTNFNISKKAELYNERGLAYRRLNKLNQASADYTRAMEFGTKLEKSISYVRRGYVKYLQDDYQGSLSDNNAATRLNPRNATAYMDLGDTYVKLGQRDKAVATYRQALKISPNLKGAKEGLAQLAKKAPATPKPAPKPKTIVLAQATGAAPAVSSSSVSGLPDLTGLPPEVQADLLAIDLENAMKAGDRARSKALLAALKPLADKTGQEFWFNQGKALAELKWYVETKMALNNYLNITGSNGKNYEQAIQLFARVSKQATAAQNGPETKFAKAKQLLRQGDGAAAKKMLAAYLAQVGRKGKRYQEAIKLYIEAEAGDGTKAKQPSTGTPVPQKPKAQEVAKSTLPSEPTFAGPPTRPTRKSYDGQLLYEATRNEFSIWYKVTSEATNKSIKRYQKKGKPIPSYLKTVPTNLDPDEIIRRIFQFGTQKGSGAPWLKTSDLKVAVNMPVCEGCGARLVVICRRDTKTEQPGLENIDRKLRATPATRDLMKAMGYKGQVTSAPFSNLLFSFAREILLCNAMVIKA